MTLIKTAFKKTPSAMLLMAALMSTSAPQAQTPPSTEEKENHEQWYQIEVLIFAYAQPAQGVETWPTDLGLKYPSRIVKLQQAFDREALLNNELSLEDSNSGSFASAFPVRAAAAPKIPGEPHEAANSDEVLQNPNLQNQESPDHLSAQLEEQPFTLLPEEELQLRAIANKLLRQQDIRRLFHAAWRQPIGPRNDSESILVRGGDPYDNHFELEGSLNFGLERYLHISTDLWLSRFVSNHGGQQNPWPVLPPLPAEASLLSGQALQLSFEGNTPLKLAGVDTSDNSLATTGFNHTTADAPMLNFKAMEFENLFSDLKIQKYSVERTVTMRQQRRMRSSELHYLDHPLMGLLVKIIPYDRPEPESAEMEPIETEGNTIDLENGTASPLQ